MLFKEKMHVLRDQLRFVCGLLVVYDVLMNEQCRKRIDQIIYHKFCSYDLILNKMKSTKCRDKMKWLNTRS